MSAQEQAREAVQAGVPGSIEASRPEHMQPDEQRQSFADEPTLYDKPSTNTSDSSDTEAGYEPIRTEDRRRLTDLARTYSSQSHPARTRTNDLSRIDTIDEMDESDPKFDPTSDRFNLVLYLRRIMKMASNDDILFKNSGVVMQGVNVSGTGAALNLQGTVDSMLLAPLQLGQALRSKSHKHILRNVNVCLDQGELLLVLGRPGAGCSTFLKTLTGESHGLHVDQGSVIDYSGIPQQRMMKEFKGEVIYNQEVDKHFPHLTVGQTLEHAAALRAPARVPEGFTRDTFSQHITQVVMAMYGLSHTYNTKVGNDFVRGVSGGERKRVSIAEMALAGSPIAAWDNSTRGLDSASALTFTKSLRVTADIMSSTHAVAIYQASQAIYDLFDKVLVLYEGRQIYFGRATKAKAYFEQMGWYFPARQTTGDCLTSVTNPVERQARKGYENRVPRTPDEFAARWEASSEYAELQQQLASQLQQTAKNADEHLHKFRASKNQQQGKHVRRKSPYNASIGRQIRLNLRRAAQRAWNDKASTFTPIFSNIIIALIIGSVFYGTAEATAGFNSLGAVLFFAILINALAAISEIANLYAQRPIVEKHKSYAFYHPWTEAMAGLVLDVPVKLMTCIAFNIVLYFLANLRREPGAFFLYLLMTYIITFVMAAVFRTMAALTKTVSQAMALAGILILAIVNYTGYSLPVPYMHPWLSWIRYINPVFYGFEFLVVNQFHGIDFTCSDIVPAYTPLQGTSWICSATGAVAGQDYVNGDAYIEAAFEYSHSHKWRDFGIVIAFLIGFMVIYFVAVELNSSTTSTAEVLVFRRGHAPKALTEGEKASDEEKGDSVAAGQQSGEAEKQLDVLAAQKDIFTWHNVVYDIEIKGNPRRLLDNVSGWVKPGTLTALMGSSGAGKTTLLDCLAQRVTMGVITGDMLVNGKPLDAGFQRKTGYVQQQDLHLQTATVRESLRFSAMLRQPKTVSREEKYEYVEQVIKMLGMEAFAEAVVGVPGEGLNVEQRKLLTIGVELAAKPKLLLFLDEPTSGLDSQSSWAICAFLRKLADHGQAVLCTIHQPSAILFEQFDRLLFLKKGGQTVYFGDVGKNSRTLLDYFEGHGARTCSDKENPAEYMLEMVNDPDHDWHETWLNSEEFQANERELERIHQETPNSVSDDEEASAHDEFAMPFTTQLREVTYRVAQQYWRMPAYVMAKFVLSIASGLFIGFSFWDASVSIQGMQNVLYALFMVASIFTSLVQQIQPLFITQRDLYEVRERPSKAYTWKAFVLANMFIELPYQFISGILTFACFYFPVVGADQSSERQVLVLLCCIALFMYASSFAHLTIAALPDAATAGAIVVLLFSMCLIFCGIIQSPSGLPGFWIFMYRASPLTYWVGAMAAAMMWGREITCSDAEFSVFDPPSGETCGNYLASYLTEAYGTLENPDATSGCKYCQLSSADQYLSGTGVQYSERWRNFGLIWVFFAFNIGATLFLYWFFRARKMESRAKTKKAPKKEAKEKH